MCGRYVSPDRAAIERAWQIARSPGDPSPGDSSPSDSFARRYNVQPTTAVPILVRDRGVRLLRFARWGLVPHWWKEEKPPKFTFNARLEEAPTKPMWREPLRRGRCLVPAEGWYEWRTLRRTDPQTGEVIDVKEPHYIRRRDGGLFCFAGLVSLRATAGADEPAASCAILTTTSAGPIAEIHERMPVVLRGDALEVWLDETLADAHQATDLARQAATLQDFEHYRVRRLVNNARNEGPALIEPDSGGAPGQG